MGGLRSYCQGRPRPGDSLPSFCCLWAFSALTLQSEVGLLGVPGQLFRPYLSAGTETHQGLSPWPCLKVSQNRLFPGIGEPEGGRKNSLCVGNPGPGSLLVTWALACASPALAKAALGIQAESMREPGVLVTPQLHISQLGSLGKPPNLSESIFCLSNIGGELGRPQGAAGLCLLVQRGQARAGGPALWSEQYPGSPCYVLEQGCGVSPGRHCSQA